MPYFGIHLRQVIAATIVLIAIAEGMSGASSWASDVQNVRNDSTYLAPKHIPFPAYNPHSPAKEKLGKALFFDTKLSGLNTIACASCHRPDHGWADPRTFSKGAKGTPRSRHTPSLINRAWGENFGWDGRRPTLEAFVLAPIANKEEMDQNLDALMDELRSSPGYRRLFAAAFPAEPMSIDHVSLSIATFLRTVRSISTPFDHWIAGDDTAMPADAVSGFRLFTGKAGCAACHTGWNFTDERLHDTGLPSEEQASKTHRFKTPSLRGVSKTAPYMHDGSLETLGSVIDHYENGFVKRASLSPMITGLSLSHDEKLNLLAFLRMLSGTKSENGALTHSKTR